MAKKALHAVDSIDGFAGDVMGGDRFPGETTTLSFRQLLEGQELKGPIFTDVSSRLVDTGTTLHSGTLGTATSMDAPSSGKSEVRSQNHEMSSTGNRPV